ncbi:Uncharacterized protein dnm_016220 [Desulfonema magnum]|uniref:Uncharacterized protein n=1 Tax=Desulfonema magnum TaxID=45655 RepID=A0A975BHT2_9BACT|nr:Uncharacterized protein dnm_016220 [Desulfonema magnum]
MITERLVQESPLSRSGELTNLSEMLSQVSKAEAGGNQNFLIC